jgi:hypothetical protein
MLDEPMQDMLPCIYSFAVGVGPFAFSEVYEKIGRKSLPLDSAFLFAPEREKRNRAVVIFLLPLCILTKTGQP